MVKLSKTEVKKEIKEFFTNIQDKNSKEVRKIKKLAMEHNLPLGELRKKFCKKCFSPYKNPKVRINNKTKSVTCGGCGYAGRWKIK